VASRFQSPGIRGSFHYICLHQRCSRAWTEDRGGQRPRASLYEIIRYIRFTYLSDLARVWHPPASYGVHSLLLLGLLPWLLWHTQILLSRVFLSGALYLQLSTEWLFDEFHELVLTRLVYREHIIFLLLRITSW